MKHPYGLLFLVAVISVLFYDAYWNADNKAKCKALGGESNLSGQCYKIVVVDIPLTAVGLEKK